MTTPTKTPGQPCPPSNTETINVLEERVQGVPLWDRKIVHGGQPTCAQCGAVLGSLKQGHCACTTNQVYP